MENSTFIKLELGIAAQRIISQLHLQNENIEAQIKKGIELGLDDLIKDDNFVQIVRESTKTEMLSIVNKVSVSWDLRNKISKLVEEKIGKKLDEYADKIAEQITKSLD